MLGGEPGGPLGEQFGGDIDAKCLQCARHATYGAARPSYGGPPGWLRTYSIARTILDLSLSCCWLPPSPQRRGPGGCGAGLQRPASGWVNYRPRPVPGVAVITMLAVGAYAAAPQR